MSVVSSDNFREVMRLVPTGVFVVTTRSKTRGNVGFTANSVTSVSLSPASVLVLARHGMYAGECIGESRVMGLNLIGGDDRHIAERFASSWAGTSKFDGIEHVLSDAARVPHIASAVAFLECRVVELIPAFDHTILLGEVIGTSSCNKATPLLYWQSAYQDVSAITHTDPS